VLQSRLFCERVRHPLKETYCALPWIEVTASGEKPDDDQGQGDADTHSAANHHRYCQKQTYSCLP